MQTETVYALVDVDPGGLVFQRAGHDEKIFDLRGHRQFYALLHVVRLVKHLIIRKVVFARKRHHCWLSGIQKKNPEQLNHINSAGPFLHLKMSKIVQKRVYSKNGSLLQNKGSLTDSNYNLLIFDKI